VNTTEGRWIPVRVFLFLLPRRQYEERYRYGYVMFKLFVKTGV